VAFAIENYRMSERRACGLLGVERSSYRYQAVKREDEAVKQTLNELARRHPRYGYRRLTVLLRRSGQAANHKRVWRLYRALELGVRRCRRRKLYRAPVQAARLTGANQEWAMDFVSDGTASGQRLRALTIVDAYTRECLEIRTATSLGSARVIDALERVAGSRGLPPAIRVDNGPEFTSRQFRAWCEHKGVGIVYIQPGKPTQNAIIESFHARLRDECLNANWFWNLADARSKIAYWREHYNNCRPHSSLGYRTPAEFCAGHPLPQDARPRLLKHNEPSYSVSMYGR
jgi:putative transposase